MSGEMPRGYVKRARAEGEAATRRRILGAALSLWRDVGPAATRMTAVAERAGVRRSTVYRHFPSEAALAAATASHVLGEWNLPSFEHVAELSYGPDRLQEGLRLAYGHHRANAALLGGLLRDRHVAPNLEPVLDRASDWRAALRETILDGLGRGSDLRAPALDHALSFEAWRSLTEGAGLSDEDAVRVMTAMVRAL